jgi:hypothetical protein
MRADRMQNLVTLREAFLGDVPAGERTPREDMINAANSYFEAIEHGDGERELHHPADEQKGLVYSFPMFQHRGAVHEIKIKGVPGVDVLHMNGGRDS